MLKILKQSMVYKHLSYMRHYRYLYSLIFCLRNFPLKEALKLPVLFCKGGYAEIINNGKLLLSDEFWRKESKLIIGFDSKDFSHQCEKTYLRVEGEMIVHGSFEMRRGAVLDVCGKAIFGDFFLLGCNSICRIHNYAEFGESVRFAHECQIFDTNFHPMEDPTNIGYTPFSSPIILGDHCWIGNRTTISKGTRLPSYTTIASNSLVSRDLSSEPAYTLWGGVPVRKLKVNYTRVWDTAREFEYQKMEFKWYRERYM